MEVTITQFRRDLFTLVNQAMEGTEVWVTHKGRRFKLEPEKSKGSKLSRLTKRDYINHDVPEDAHKIEMWKAIQEDWDQI
jgi:antitoxin (DNA-binding transcriptional repressor) of toxin-antitoxin stability system